MKFEDFAFRDGEQGDFGEVRALIYPRDVFLVAAQPVQGFSQDEIEASPFRICYAIVQTKSGMG